MRFVPRAGDAIGGFAASMSCLKDVDELPKTLLSSRVATTLFTQACSRSSASDRKCLNERGRTL